MTGPADRSPGRKPRAPGAVRRAARSAGRSLWHSLEDRLDPPPRNRFELLRRNLLPWVWNYLKVAFLPRRPFRAYSTPGGSAPGIYRMPDRCTAVLAADWGTGTESAYRVRDAIRRQAPDITIHLGDVYYSGTRREFERYLLGKDDWPRGALEPRHSGEALGTYALNANHEMYSGGEGYFDAALPALGQMTSYFCLENDNWRVVAVDSGYYAKSVPFLELIVNFIRLHRANLKWLADVVFKDPEDRRPAILLSHHQWFSAFDAEYERMGKQLLPCLDRVLLWFWGHEHRFAGYGPFGFDRARVRARCIGHGGMPVEVGERPKRARERPLVFTDERRAGVAGDVPVGYCGFAVLRFDGPSLTVAYFDEAEQQLLEERWMRTPDSVRGAVSLGEKLTLHGGRSLEDLVR